MKTVNIGTLKNELSAYLRYVKQGEEVIVRDRNVPVARIVPIASSYATSEDGPLIAKGQLRPQQEDSDWETFWALPMPVVADEAVKDAVDWVKGDR